MKKMRKVTMALSAAIIISLGGCASTEKTSKSAGSTGTGMVGGLAVGAGAGVACDKLTGGKNTAACAAAGVAAGALAGKLLAVLDDEWAKSEPVSRCQDVQNKLGYKASEKQPRGAMTVAFTPDTKIVKPGESLKPTVTVDLAAAEGKEISTRLRVNKDQSERIIKKECGGDYKLPLGDLDTREEGAHYLEISLIDTEGNSTIAAAQACYAVSADGKDLCSLEAQGKTAMKGKGKTKAVKKKRK